MVGVVNPLDNNAMHAEHAIDRFYMVASLARAG
jgi:hypothetical protein